ncbi:DNA alkylation repair protein [Saccharobesus litoralis]|uniref:DNA alkylation repair protein n=1 Tax=Saccharobesus litoralis TaxID=2172099 RepID=A0A2S0VXD9_9ALTE|nr:DNA alkylation repair protein [Saccharobesus litoralis]AWB68863.1 DNA alkylation repair protein [Saccharobesus litoralis]
MSGFDYNTPQVPAAPHAINKGVPLNTLLGETAVLHLARNLQISDAKFNQKTFVNLALTGLEPLSLLQRAHHIAKAVNNSLAVDYQQSIAILIGAMAEEKQDTDNFGLSGMFYLPYGSFICNHYPGLESNKNNEAGHTAQNFEMACQGILAVTKRFSAEFCIRPFLVNYRDEMLERVYSWISDENPHVRRLCSEGTRPKLPWGINIPDFIKDPNYTLKILDALKDDETLYVRRSVANHLGDIAKNHADTVFEICHDWLDGASKERKWLLRHAVRYYAKKQHPEALRIRELAK